MTNAIISAAKLLISSFSAQFPTRVTLLPVAEERLAGLDVAHQDKRQCLAVLPSVPAGSSSSIVHAQVTTVSVVVAPKGGSLDQDQLDALVKHGVTNGINYLAKFPREESVLLSGQLLAAGPEVQKGVITKMRNLMINVAWKVSAGTRAAVVNARLAEVAKKAVELDRQEKEARKQKKEEAAQKTVRRV